MTDRTDKEQMDTDAGKRTKKSGEMNSGTPNPAGSTEERSVEHKSGYGGDGGKPRTSSDKRRPDGTDA